MDYHSTTPVDPRVVDAMLPFFSKEYGNAASIDHQYGLMASRAVQESREQISGLINAKPDEIIFTSGATESDNIAIHGIANKLRDKGDHIITCKTEHKAVLDTCKYLESIGKKVTYLSVNKYGEVDIEELENSITYKTILISIMAANNEIGTIAPIKEIGKIARDHDIYFHTDAAQAAGHIPIDVQDMNINLMSMSGHKIYGPKGIGVLYVKRSNPRTMISPIIYGGGHEKGLRSGTLNVPSIVGFGKALEIAKKEMEKDGLENRKRTQKMLSEFSSAIKGTELNGHPRNRLPHNLNVYFPGIENKALINMVKNELAISTGSACTTTYVEPSHVLKALGFDDKRIFSSVRFGLGRFTTEEEVDKTIEIILDGVKRLERI